MGADGISVGSFDLGVAPARQAIPIEASQKTQVLGGFLLLGLSDSFTDRPFSANAIHSVRVARLAEAIGNSDRYVLVLHGNLCCVRSIHAGWLAPAREAVVSIAGSAKRSGRIETVSVRVAKCF